MNNRTSKTDKKIAIIGGGAAGLFAAAKALEQGAQVTVFERNETPGKKLLITGNGRCNFTNLNLNKLHFRNDNFVSQYLKKFNTNYISDFFSSLGVLSFTEKNGCFYPASQKAQTILQCLVHYIEKKGGKIRCQTCISEINKNQNNKFELLSKEHRIDEIFDSVILACGGKAAPKTGSDGYGFRLARGFGHTVSRTYPVLVQLKSDSSICKSCAGIRCRVEAAAYIEDELQRKETGELQITDYGLSGIVIFNLSRMVTKAIEEGKKSWISVDFLPELPKDKIADFLSTRFTYIETDSLLHVFEGLTNSKLVEALLKEKNYDSNLEVSIHDLQSLISLLEDFKSWNFILTGHNGYENAQCTRGGVLLDEITPDLESKLVSNLYFAGEMLDVDADCGGYNLHWAWISGEVAGNAAAKKGL